MSSMSLNNESNNINVDVAGVSNRLDLDISCTFVAFIKENKRGEGAGALANKSAVIVPFTEIIINKTGHFSAESYLWAPGNLDSAPELETC